MTDDYRQISPAICEVLYAIWELEIKLKPLGRGATGAEIAKMLHIKENYLSQLLHEIKGMPIEYLRKGTHNQNKGKLSRKKGRPLTTYHPNHDNLITIPETALIFLELLKFPTELRYYVNRDEFVAYLIKTFEFNETFIQERIDWAIKVSYIQKRSRKIGGNEYIRPLSRIDRERDWLEIVAKRYEPNNISGKRQRQKDCEWEQEYVIEEVNIE